MPEPRKLALLHSSSVPIRTGFYYGWVIVAVSALSVFFAASVNTVTNSLFIESYMWNNWGESVMAMTHEGHYYRRITDNQYITGADYQALGRAQAVALDEYFNLPPDSGISDWLNYTP